MEKIKQAIEFHKKGDYVNAEKFYLDFLNDNPNEAKAYHLLGCMYMQMKDFIRAAGSLKKASELEKSTPIMTDYALCLFELEDFKTAYEYLKEVVVISDSKILYEKIIHCCKVLNLPMELLKYASLALKFYGDDIYKLRDIAALAQDLKEFESAKKYLNRLIELCPDDYIAYNNLGLVLEFTADFAGAEAAYRKAIEIHPNADAVYNLSVLLRREKKYDESLKVLELSKQFNHCPEKYKHSYGLLHLAQKDFKTGYKPYVDYLKVLQKDNIDSALWWKGAYNGNSILVINATEGFGDIFMFSRYLDFLDTSKFKDVILIVPPVLNDLYSFNFPGFKVVNMGQKVIYNYATILLDLPLIYNIDFEHIPSTDKYLMAPPLYCEKWKGCFRKDRLNVGLFFAGNTEHKRSLYNRKIDFEMLKPLLSVDNTDFYSLQPEDTFKEIFLGQNIMDLSDKIMNFSDTAAIIENMDVVISVDSAVAHLAGSMGKKTLLMLPYSADWRWFDEEDKCSWYDSVKIFRQDTEGDWKPVVDRVKTEIEKSFCLKFNSQVS